MRLPKINKIPGSIDECEFFSKIKATDDCWEWIGVMQKYGAFRVDKKYIKSHRISYWLFNNKQISETGEYVIDHICMNKKCVNPDHLREVHLVVNALENTKSSALKRKMQTHCSKGHEYTPENTVIDGRGKYGGKWRKCRACRTERNKIYWQRKLRER